MSSLEAPGQNEEQRPRRYWFAETIVVLGILAFAYFAFMLESQRQQAASPPPAVVASVHVG